MADRRAIGAATVGGAFLAAAMAVHPGTAIDDSFILYRYAVNLAAGLGPCYSPGEPVEGFTCFSWTYLLAGLAWVGLDVVRWGPILCALFGLGVLATTYAIARATDLQARSAWLVTLLTAVSGPVCYWSTQGLETPLFALLLLAGIALDLRVRAQQLPRRDLLLSALAFGVAAATRPEGAFGFALASCLLGLEVVKGRRSPRDWLAHAATFLALIVPLIAWRWVTFGALVPNTYWTKAHGSPLDNLRRGLPYLRDSFDLLGGQPWLPDLPSAIVGAALLFCVPVLRGLWAGGARRRLALYVGLYVSAIMFEGGDWMPFARFLVPLVPLMLVLLAACCAEAPPRARPWLQAGVVLWLVTGWVVDVHARVNGPTGLRRDAQGLQHAHEAVGRWLNDVRRPGDSVAAGDIGYIGYYADMPLIDLLGLVDPHLSRMPGSFPHKQIDVDAVLDRRPTFAVIVGGFPQQGRLARSDRFLAEYRFLFARNLGAFMQPPKPHWLLVYVRRDRDPAPPPLPSTPGEPIVLVAPE